jgi:1,2-dihydroxy-3-keto-5-methylthiopentene dioxygenase
MSYLREYTDPKTFTDFTDFEKIHAQLKKNAILLEKWDAGATLAESAGAEEVLVAYQSSIEELKNRRGFKTEDVVAINPDTPNHSEMRNKFLQEHTHRDDEARYFVEGSGLFYINNNNHTVQLLLCEKGELINLPAGTRHWFDMGSQPYFKAIRVFLDPEGWVGNFTGSGVDQDYPGFDEFMQSLKR